MIKESAPSVCLVLDTRYSMLLACLETSSLRTISIDTNQAEIEFQAASILLFRVRYRSRSEKINPFFEQKY